MEQLSFEITAELRKLNKGLDRASAKIDNFAQKNEQKFKKFGKSMTNVGQKMTVGLTVPLGLLAAQSVKTFASFDDQMRKVGVTAGATGQDLQALTDIAEKLGSETRFSAREAASGLEFMALAGFDTQQAISAIPDVLNLAAAAALDLGSASDIVTDTMNAFGIKAENASNVSDVFASTQSKATTNVLQLGEAFKLSAANANSFGTDVETASAILGKLADAGIKGSRAGTTLNAIFRDIKDSADNNVLALNGQSIALADSEGNFRDILDILEDVETATGGLSQAQRSNALDAIFQERSIRGVNTIMSQGVKEAKDLRKELRASTGTAKSMADEMEGGLGGALRSLNASFESLTIELGRVLAPVMQKIVSFIKSLINGYKSLDDTTKRVIAVIGGLVAAAGPLLLVIGGIASALPAILTGLAALTGPIGLVVAAIGGLTAIVIANWDTITAWAEDIANYFIKLYNESIVFKTGVELVTNAFKAMFRVGKFIFTSIWTIVKTVVKQIADNFRGLGTIIEGVLTFDTNKIKKGFTDIAESLGKNIGRAFGNIKADAEKLFNDLGSDVEETINDIKYNKIPPVDFSASKESKEKIKKDVEKAVKEGTKKGLSNGLSSAGNVSTVIDREQVDPVASESFSIGQAPMTPEIIKAKGNEMLTAFQQFSQDLDRLVQNTAGGALSDLGTAIGEALAQGTSVTQAIGQSLIQSFSQFLSRFGDLLIQYGLASKAFGAVTEAIKGGGPASIGAGIAAIAIGTAMKGIASAIGSSVSDGVGGGGTGANAGGGGVNNNFSQSFTSTRRDEIILRAKGRDLVAVLNAQGNFNNALG